MHVKEPDMKPGMLITTTGFDSAADLLWRTISRFVIILQEFHTCNIVIDFLPRPVSEDWTPLPCKEMPWPSWSCELSIRDVFQMNVLPVF